MNVRTVTATRYVVPLREGGSLPAIVEADDEGTYVLKFRGAGQGAKALISELVVGEIARSIGLNVPELVFVHLDPVLAKTEPDPEIQELIKASEGLNLALDYLPGSITFDPLVSEPITENPTLASAVVWLDAYTSNVDRTSRNSNLLVRHDTLWLIDHGAALYFHHRWGDYTAESRRPFTQIKDHVLLPFAGSLLEVDRTLSSRITPQLISDIVRLIPDSWLGDVPQFADIEEHRAAYASYLLQRLESPRVFVEEAHNAYLRV